MLNRVLKNRAAPVLLILLSIAMVMWQNWPVPIKPSLSNISEQWRPELSTVKSISDALPIVAVYISEQVGTHDERVVRGIDAFVRDRFVHGSSYIATRDNWLLKSTFGMISDTYRSPVDVDDILRHRRAICSQQSIVFMELLRRYGLSYGAVLFVWPDPDPTYHGHFAVAARVDGHWRYYDSDLEAADSPLIRSVIDGTAIAKTYPNDPRLVERMKYAAAHGGITLAYVNTYAAPHGKILQDVTHDISEIVPLVLAVVALVLFLIQRKSLWRSSPIA